MGHTSAASASDASISSNIQEQVEYRILKPDSDGGLYQKAIEWQESYPDWLKDADPAYNIDVFLEHARTDTQLDLGCWHDGKFVAIASFWDWDPGHIEMTIWASREARAEWLAPGIWEIGNYLFELDAEEIYCVVARYHRANRGLAQACWGEWDGSRRLTVTSRGRIIEWMRYAINREQWIKHRDQQEERNHLGRADVREHHPGLQ